MVTPSNDESRGDDVAAGFEGRSDAVAFFDIGDTLAAVTVSPGGTGIESLVPLPGAVDALAALRDAGVRMGIISNRGRVSAEEVDAALARAGLAPFFDWALTFYGSKDSTAIFEQAALTARSNAPVPPRRLLFVGEDSTERWYAEAAGFLACPHVTLAPRMLLVGSPLRFLRIRVPPAAAGADWPGLLRERPVVPLHVAGGGTPEIYAIADSDTALVLDDLGFWVDRLGRDEEPRTSDLYLLRDDGRAIGDLGAGTGSAASLFAGDREADRVLTSTAAGLYVALPAGRSVESLHVGRPRHGHNLKLTAQPLLGDAMGAQMLDQAVTEPTGPSLTAAAELTPDETEVIVEQVTAARLQQEVQRYSGARPVAQGISLSSRHIQHPDNPRAVTTLLTDLASLGGDRLTVRPHRFSHGGRRHDNVEATLAARGLPGTVLVTAHLDSTAARGPGYRPPVDPAPGADDDGSGIAAVLTATRTILALDERIDVPRREVRFVLFNAEEQGLVGSRAYARTQAVQGVPIVAALQIDMIGFDAVTPQTFELHAGFSPSEAVQARSIALAELVAAQVPRVSDPLPAPQLYPGPDGAPDPAEERSDHYSFQLNGYPACLATEDFFAGPTPESPDADPNPHYHSPGDRTIDAGYASGITRAMTAAAWICATR